MLSFPVFKNTHFWIVLAGVFLYQLLAIKIFVFFPDHIRIVTFEGHAGENIAAVGWGLTALFCLTKLLFFMSSKDNLWQWLWIMFAGILGCTRELDMHERVEEFYGMTWNTDWLYADTTHIVLKILMYAMMITVVGGMLGSVLWNGKKILAELKAGNELVTLICLGFGFMSVGFLCDGSVLGTPVIYPIVGREFGILMEEVFETVAAIIFFLAVFPYFWTRKTNLKTV